MTQVKEVCTYFRFFVSFAYLTIKWIRLDNYDVSAKK